MSGRHLRVTRALALALVFAPLAQAQVAGRWEGRIDIPGQPLEVIVVLADAAGALSGTISIPAQNAHDLPLKDVALIDGRVRFAIVGPPGEPRFDGAVSADGAKLEGEFRQATLRAPFALARAAQVATADALAGFAEFVEAARKAHDVPGLSVAIVKDGKTIFAQGFGVADVDTGRAVTEHSLFAIGSSTKAFTALALAMVLAEGKHDWETKVRAVLPEFDLADPVAAMQCTLRDLAAHRSGLPRHDLVWYLAPVDRADLLRKLPHLPLSKPVRDQFQYCNHGFAVLGAVLERMTGKSYDDVVRARLLTPLGMTRTRFGLEELTGVDDVASAHTEKKDKLTVIPRRAIGGMGPAGYIESSARDMARWVAFQLGKGSIDGTKVCDGPLLRVTHTPITAMGLPDSAERGIIPAGYALGWFVESYRGHLHIQHGGGIDGFIAHVGFYPFDGIGVVAFANRDGTGLPALIDSSAADRLLGLERTDQVGKGAARRRAAKAAAAAAAKAAAEPASAHAGTKPAHALADYAGEYEHPGYGVAKVSVAGESLRVAFADLDSKLTHVHFETFGLADQEDSPLEKLKLLFVTGVGGDVDALSVALEPAVEAIVFQRRGDAALQTAEYLQRFVGEYAGAGVARIAAGDGVLLMTVPGQPTYTLTPTRRNAFVFADVKGFRARFEGEGERAAALILQQPNGDFRLERKD